MLIDHGEQPRAVLLLGHGAGGGPQAPDLALLARRLPPFGVTVVRVEQPWRLAGRKVAVRPPLLDEAWLELVAAPPWGDLPGVSGGRSSGARVACRTAAVTGVVGVVCLAFPLHLPGRPERSRVAELLAPTVPRLVLQGSRDTFGGTEEVRAAVAGAPGVQLVELPGADHSFGLPRTSAFTPADLRERLVAEVLAFLGRVVPVMSGRE
ncbi:alpha/beta family hydrolase [uncultured Friedmanniella sp.]|uniref:alpha/beta hydrolase family protein n=1 Tax=uncultured Friedmanniella sp. TaxID=335381 RepID=UPI0035CA849B